MIMAYLRVYSVEKWIFVRDFCGFLCSHVSESLSMFPCIRITFDEIDSSPWDSCWALFGRLPRPAKRNCFSTAFAQKCKVIYKRDPKSHARYITVAISLTKDSHNTGNFMPDSFRIVCGFFNVPHWSYKHGRRRRLESLKEILQI